MEDRKCPLCREEIPPSKEMVTQLKCLRDWKSSLEAKGDVFSQHYMTAKTMMEKLECQIGDWAETIEYSDDNFLVLPSDIHQAARKNNIQKVLDWLGPVPVDKQRVNAKNPDMLESTLVFPAVIGRNSDLLSILFQLGADIDPVDASGGTPLSLMGDKPEYYAQARLLLEWGAEISNDVIRSKDQFIEYCLGSGNSKLANLLESEFGGRRCEIINLSKHPDLIGKTCVVEKFLPDKGRYKVIFEASKEVGLVGPENIVRRDRTPDDCGYYISYANGKTTRHDFASKEEFQAFVTSLTDEGKKLGDVDAEAEARAEEAATSLLAELDLDSSAASDVGSKKSKQKGKKKGKKKGRK